MKQKFYFISSFIRYTIIFLAFCCNIQHLHILIQVQLYFFIQLQQLFIQLIATIRQLFI